MELTYADAGVNIDNADDAVAKMKGHIRSTFNANVLSDVGNFGGIFQLNDTHALIASIDGVGTKLQVATRANRHTTVGADLASHCLNDIIVQGPVHPLFFLDYFGTVNLDPVVAEQVIGGLCATLRDHNCVLIGGETAEMPGTYVDGEYDLVGGIIGITMIKDIIDGSTIGSGDVAIGLASYGLGTNGYSLARKVCFDVKGLNVNDIIYQDDDCRVSVADALLHPHRCYHKSVFPLMNDGIIKAAAHVTGGGIPGNTVRVIPDGASLFLDRNKWVKHTPKIFDFIRKNANQPWDDYFKTFNDGIGMVLIVSEEHAEQTIRLLTASGELAISIGHIECNSNPARGVFMSNVEDDNITRLI